MLKDLSHMTTTTTRPANMRLSDQLPDETLVQWLKDMVLIREFELRTMAAYQQAKIGGFCHIYIGQEAVVVGSFACLEDDDPVITAYRDHGHALARGTHPNIVMAEMYGKLVGCAKGKGGSMHMFDRPNHLYGGHGIVGAQTPLGLGIAFATRYEREVLENTDRKRVTLCFLGDGALNQGAVHEAKNLAVLLGAPVIYIVENNKYSMGTAIDRGTTMAHDLSAKAHAYGMEYLELEAMDPRVVYDQFKPLVDLVREEQRPAFVNMHCYRYQGHSMSDPQKYRTKEEVAQYQDRDGIDALAHELMANRKAMTEDEFKEIQRWAKEVSKDAIKFAEDAADPDPAKELYSDVFLNPLPQMSPIREYHSGSKNSLLEE